MVAATLEAVGISKRYEAVRALDDAHFAAYPGSVVALVGDNGAGKSTLVKAISGAAPAGEGVILFEGQPVSMRQPADATSLGIATVFQDLALCDNLDVVANLYLGRARTRGIGRLIGWRDETAMEIHANELLTSLAVSIPSVRTPVGSLSGGQRQSVAIARALLASPKLVILDEPTAALGVSQTRQVLDLVTRLKDNGLAVVLISHNLGDVFSVADRIEVLRLGKNNGSFITKETTPADVVAAITGATDDKIAQYLASAERKHNAPAGGPERNPQ
ncbi:ATP-binding cassette domain-containing protein [Acrocarpospora macrocephala]|uniref:ABC transporter ATP-binding protein n=1 Tax=Acrocarpospora macrocephala TaxID=150177 RepID=A0A5M3WH95_9ACTN|nr:ATP-binding cassette domain-containing protein [Acrocarpospora macrocephala]GES06491.1 ABC transporter ATP-binding protein [Acrocarpospora macrocephala]